MSPLNTAMMLLVGAILINTVVMRLSSLWHRPVVFWSLQAFNLVAAVVTIVYGVPGFEHWGLPTFIFAGFFVFRIVMNWAQRNDWVGEARRTEMEKEYDRLRDENERLSREQARSRGEPVEDDE